MKIKNIKIFMVFLCFLLCGCSAFNYEEPENKILCTALGIDYVGEEYVVCYETAEQTSPLLLAGTVFTANGKTLKDAFLFIEKNLYKTPVFFKCPVIFFGEALNGEQIVNAVSFLTQNYGFSFSVALVNTKSAKELLNQKNEWQTPMGLLAYSLIKKNTNRQNTAIKVLGQNSFSLPQIKVLNGNLQITGSNNYEK